MPALQQCRVQEKVLIESLCILGMPVQFAISGSGGNDAKQYQEKALKKALEDIKK